MIDLIGYMAGFLTIISFLPQVVKSWRTRKTDDLSMMTGILLAIGAVMWTIYGLLLSSMPMIATNIIVMFCVIAIISVHFFPLNL